MLFSLLYRRATPSRDDRARSSPEELRTQARDFKSKLRQQIAQVQQRDRAGEPENPDR